MRNRIILSIILVFLFAAVLVSQALLVSVRYGDLSTLADCPWCDSSGQKADVVFVPVNVSLLRLLFPADTDFLADMIWIRTVYYFGKHALTDRQYPYLFHLVDLVTDLAPRWLYPFLFGAIVLPTETKIPEEGLFIIDKGLDHHAGEWRLWFYRGYYLWKSESDLEGASQSLLQASLRPGSPRYLGRLSATLATRAGQRELAVRFLEEAIKSAKDPLQRELLLEKLWEISDNGGPE